MADENQSPETESSKEDLKALKDMLKIVEAYRALDPTNKAWVRDRMLQIDQKSTPAAG